MYSFKIIRGRLLTYNWGNKVNSERNKAINHKQADQSTSSEDRYYSECNVFLVFIPRFEKWVIGLLSSKFFVNTV